METIDYKAKGDSYKIMGISHYISERYDSAEVCLKTAVSCYNKTKSKYRYEFYRDEINDSVNCCKDFLGRIKHIKSKDDRSK